jgi:hypothetical protein
VTRKSVKYDNDATSYYNRIITVIAAITSRKYGVHCNVAFVMASTLKEAKYKLRTILGISEEFYQHRELSPIYGTGQGSGNSPVICCVISSGLFDCHATSAQGATYTSPDGTESITLYMVGFVDDSTGQTNFLTDRHEPPPNVLLTAPGKDAQLWSDLL